MTVTNDLAIRRALESGGVRAPKKGSFVDRPPAHLVLKQSGGWLNWRQK
jgi:hypothetical protein